MAETAAGVAGGLPRTAIASSAVASTLVATSVATGTLSAVPGDVTPLAALVALLATTLASHGGTAILGAFAADVAGLAAAVAALLSLGSGALAAQVALVTAVVAGGVTLARAVGRTVGRVATYEISQRSWESVLHRRMNMILVCIRKQDECLLSRVVSHDVSPKGGACRASYP